MSEVINFPNQNPTQKEYWGTGEDTHKLLGVDNKKAEQFRVKVNKIHFLFEKGVLNKNDEKTGVDKEMVLYDDLAKSFTGGAEFRFAHREIEFFTNALDAMQNILQNKDRVVLNQLPYQTVEDLVSALIKYKNTNTQEKGLIEDNLRKIITEGQRFNLALAA